MNDAEDRIINASEVYVFCNECGARLWSDDALPGERRDRNIMCPYKHNFDLAERMGCVSERDASANYPVIGHFD